MKLIYVFLASLFLISTSAVSSAKSNTDEMKAKYLYTHLAFHDAIPYYEKVLAKMGNRELYEQLGDCYRATGDYEKAAANYRLAMGLEEKNDIVILHFAQTLMTLAQYTEAREILLQLQPRHAQDKRIDNLIKGCQTASEGGNIKPAGRVTFEDFNTDGSEFAPVLWKDKLVFTSDSANGIKKRKDKWTGNTYYNMYSVTCDKDGHCTPGVNKVSADKSINIKYHDGPCTFTADGETMYFTRTRYTGRFLNKRAVTNGSGQALLEIMIASGYDEDKQQFRKITQFPYNSTAYSVANPAISPDGSTLVFSSDMPGGSGGTDLYVCQKMTDGAWSRPQGLGGNVNTEGEELFPFFADDKTLYFSSDGHPGQGGLDVYKSIWDAGRHAFSAPENVGAPVNSSYDDISLAIASDGSHAYFSSNRPAEKKGDNIYFYKKEETAPRTSQDGPVARTMIPGTNVAPVAAAVTNAEKAATTMQPPVAETPPAGQKEPETTHPPTIASAAVPVAAKPPIPERTQKTTGRGTTSAVPVQLDTKPVVPKPRTPAGPGTPIAPSAKHVELTTPENTKEISVDGHVYVMGESYALPGFHYAYKQADITKGAEKELDILYEILAKHPELRLQVNAFTDCRGNADFNLKLSYARARSVVKYLEQRGVSAKRLSYKGFGASRPVMACPVCSECTEEQHYLNRGIEFKVTKI